MITKEIVKGKNRRKFEEKIEKIEGKETSTFLK